MKDIEVIHKFYEQISWVDQCHEITYDGRTMLANPYTLAVPSHWQQWHPNLAFIIPLAQEYSLEPELIIWGNPNPYDTEKISWKVIKSGAHIVFIDVKARLTYSRFVLRSLDGANFQKTFENFIADIGEVIWTWDEKQS
jgi:hypothetical protein